MYHIYMGIEDCPSVGVLREGVSSIPPRRRQGQVKARDMMDSPPVLR
jgi:hypothetical protein